MLRGLFLSLSLGFSLSLDRLSFRLNLSFRLRLNLSLGFSLSLNTDNNALRQLLLSPVTQANRINPRLNGNSPEVRIGTAEPTPPSTTRIQGDNLNRLAISQFQCLTQSLRRSVDGRNSIQREEMRSAQSVLVSDLSDARECLGGMRWKRGIRLARLGEDD